MNRINQILKKIRFFAYKTQTQARRSMIIFWRSNLDQVGFVCYSAWLLFRFLFFLAACFISLALISLRGKMLAVFSPCFLFSFFGVLEDCVLFTIC